jgi:hypothetical protein
LTVTLALAAVYVLIGIAPLPVWAVGAVFRVDAMRRAGGWWLLPFVLHEAGESVVERVTAPRDGSRWKRPDPTPRPEDEPEPSGAAASTAAGTDDSPISPTISPEPSSRPRARASGPPRSGRA